MPSEQRDVIKVSCERCGARYGLPRERLIGRVLKIRCKQCREVFEVRGEQQAGPQTAASGSAGGSARVDAKLLSRGARRWFAVVDRRRVGPITEQEIRDRFRDEQIGPRTFLWRQGMKAWARLAQLDEFSDLARRRSDSAGPSARSARQTGEKTATAERPRDTAAEAARREDSEVSTLVAPESLFAAGTSAARRPDGTAAERLDTDDPAGGRSAAEQGDAPPASGAEGGAERIEKVSTGDAPADYPMIVSTSEPDSGAADGAQVAAVVDAGAAREERDQSADSAADAEQEAPPAQDLVEYAAGASRALKAQRQESSVLFALDNLVALAKDAPAEERVESEPEPEPIAIVPSTPPREVQESTGIEQPPPSELVLRGEQERLESRQRGSGRLFGGLVLGLLLGAAALAGGVYVVRPDVVDALLHGSGADRGASATARSAPRPPAAAGSSGGAGADDQDAAAGALSAKARTDGASPGSPDGAPASVGSPAASASPDGGKSASPKSGESGAHAGKSGAAGKTAAKESQSPRRARPRSRARRGRHERKRSRSPRSGAARSSEGSKNKADERDEPERSEPAGGKPDQREAAKPDTAKEPAGPVPGAKDGDRSRPTKHKKPSDEAIAAPKWAE